MSSIAPISCSARARSPARSRSSSWRRSSLAASARPLQYGATSSCRSSGVGSGSSRTSASVSHASASSFLASASGPFVRTSGWLTSAASASARWSRASSASFAAAVELAAVRRADRRRARLDRAARRGDRDLAGAVLLLERVASTGAERGDLRARDPRSAYDEAVRRNASSGVRALRQVAHRSSRGRLAACAPTPTARGTRRGRRRRGSARPTTSGDPVKYASAIVDATATTSTRSTSAAALRRACDARRRCVATAPGAATRACGQRRGAQRGPAELGAAAPLVRLKHAEPVVEVADRVGPTERVVRDRSSGGTSTTAHKAARTSKTTSVKTSRPPLLSRNGNNG